MAYNLKYELLCTTRKANLYKLKLLFDGYSGSPIDRNVPVSPFKLVKDKAAVIRGTSLEFSIREEVDFEFLEFHTNNNKKIKAELYQGTTLIWAGYNLPQQYQVPYIPPPVSISFIASDGLGLLKNEPFTLIGRASQLSIICHCINKIGLALGYSIAIDLFEITHNHTYSPLDQTYEESEIFAGLKCYEVLEKILNKYDAEITQRRGRWAITRSVDKKSTRMLYTSAGVYDTAEAAPAVLDLGYPHVSGVEVWPRNRLNMSVESGGNQVTIKQSYARKPSILLNSDFALFSSGLFNEYGVYDPWAIFTSWLKNGSFTPEQKFNDNGPYLHIAGTGATDYLYQSIDVISDPDEDFVFSVKLGAVYTDSVGNPMYNELTVRVRVSLTSGATTMYLTTSGWVATASYIDTTCYANVSGLPEFVEKKIITDALPFSGTLRVELKRFGTSYPGYWSVCFQDVNVTFLRNGEPYPEGNETLVVFSNSTEPSVLSDINLLACDAPVRTHSSLSFKNITWLSSGAITTLWHRLGSELGYTLLTQLALTLASNNRVARQKLIGEIKGSGIAFDSIIKHAYNNNREFEIAEGIWDIYEEVFNATLLELLPWSSEPIVLTDSEGVHTPLAPSLHFQMCFVRNLQMDNTLSLSASTKLAISAKNSLVLTIDNLPDYAKFDESGWVAMLVDADKTSTSDPTFAGDYYHKFFCTIERSAKTLTFAAGTDLTAWEVTDNLALYNPFINFDFVGSQSSAPLISVSGAPAWRSMATGTGPMFRHSDGRFINMFIGFQASPTTGRIGYAHSTDMATWTIGNTDNYVYAPTSLPECSSINLTGPCYPCNDGTGRYWCLIFYGRTSDGHGVHRILYFDEDLTTFTYSGTLMTDRELGFAGGSIVKVGDYYHLIYMLIASAGVPYRSINAAKSSSLEGPYTDYQTNIVRGYGSNDGVAWSYTTDAPTCWDDGVKVRGIFGAQAQWSQSGNKGNRLYCLLDFDPETEVWSVNFQGPALINPMYYQDLNGTYTWAGDHCGGYPAIFIDRISNETYACFTMKGSLYQVTTIKLKFY